MKKSVIITIDIICNFIGFDWSGVADPLKNRSRFDLVMLLFSFCNSGVQYKNKRHVGGFEGEVKQLYIITNSWSQ